MDLRIGLLLSRFSLIGLFQPSLGVFFQPTYPGIKFITQTYNIYTLTETNIAPENRPLEKEIPIKNHYF